MLGSLKALYFDLSAIIILIVILAAVFSRRLTKGRDNVLYISLCLVVFVTTIADMWDTAYETIWETTAYNIRWRHFINYTYFLLHNLTAPLFLLYMASIIGIWHKLTGKWYTLAAIFSPYIISVIMLISNFFNASIFYFDSSYIYHRGSRIIAFYFVAAFYFALDAYIFAKYSALVTKRTLMILWSFVPVMIGTVILQMIYSQLRVEMFATTTMTMIMCIGVQRPDENIDFVVNIQNNNAFMQDMKKAELASRRVSVLLIKFFNHLSLRKSIGVFHYQELLHRFGSKMEQISSILRNSGSMYYLNHGAFAVICDEQQNDDLLDVGRILVAYLQEPMRLGQLQVMVDAKSTLIRYPEDIGNLNSFYNFAYTFHIRLKDEHRVMVLSDISDSKDFKMRNEMDLIINRGIANNNFQMYYQPIFDINKGKYLSAEALIRLKDEVYGFVSPALFIPLAEQSGAIHQIGDFVLEDVCRFIASDEFKTLGLEYIEVNLSVSQCIEVNFADKIEALMSKYHILPEQINLEITETGVDRDPEITDRNITKLASMGISFSLDDYGTGYSNIRRIVALPLSIVKLDKSLVDEMDSPMMWTVITNTVSMLKRLNIKILVEGVEELRQFERFREIACDYIQGYYFSKPLPEKEFIEFVQKKNFG